jgi:hypothetical protein
VDLIQTRNLNIDAELLFRALDLPKSAQDGSVCILTQGELATPTSGKANVSEANPQEELLGIKNMLRLIKKKHKNIKFGYFNRMKRDFQQDKGLPE